MFMHFSVIRNGITATSVNLQVHPVGVFQRFMTSYLRHSGADSNIYHITAYGHLQDISATDFLEESGTFYDVVNTRSVTGSHMELDLEKCHRL